MKSLVGKLLVYSGSFFLFIFIIANTAEVLLNVDLKVPLVNSIKPYAQQVAVNSVVRYYGDTGLKTFSKSALKSGSGFGTLDYLIFPDISTKVYVSNARQIGTDCDKKIEDQRSCTWYQRPNNAHAVVLNTDKTGAIGDYLFYTDQSWRTIPYADKINKDMDAKLVNAGGVTWDYKVIDKQILDQGQTYVAETSQEKQIILIVAVPNSTKYFAFLLREPD